MKEYSLIESDNAGEFTEAVTAAVNEGGWECQGGVAVWFQPVTAATLMTGAVLHYAQALVRETL